MDVIAKQFQLAEQTILAFVATRDPDRAKKFYRDTLGLPLVSEDLPFALVFDVSGIMLRVTVVEKFDPAPFTVLGWRVPDITVANQPEIGMMMAVAIKKLVVTQLASS